MSLSVRGDCCTPDQHKHLIRLLVCCGNTGINFTMNLGAASVSVHFLCKMIFMWVHCAETYSLDQCSHSLTHSLCKSSIQSALSHTLCEPRAFCLSFIQVRAAHTFCLSSSLFTPSRWNSSLCFCFPSAVPFGSE